MNARWLLQLDAVVGRWQRGTPAPGNQKRRGEDTATKAQNGQRNAHINEEHVGAASGVFVIRSIVTRILNGSAYALHRVART